MYLVAFGYVFSSPQMALAFTGAFVVISQLKINVTNAYAGSIAWSNFFSRLTHSHPGRVVWLVFNVTIALMLMELGIFKMLEHALGLYSIVAVSWVSALVADLVINKPLGLSPPGIEFKRAHLYDINPVGVGAMLAATAAGIAAFSGVLGVDAAIAVGFRGACASPSSMAPLIAWATKGRFYIARTPRQNWNGQEVIRCSICEHHFEAEDMAHCPAYSGADLLAVLLAGDALPRLLQAAGARLEPASRLVRRGAAASGSSGLLEHPCRPLSRSVCCCSSA